MALELQPSSDRKRVKVYELRDNDWFDRGTGFCTGQILDVRTRSLHLCPARQSTQASLAGAFVFFFCLRQIVANVTFSHFSFSRMSLEYSSNPRMNPIGCSSKQESTRMMGIKSSKVPCLPLVYIFLGNGLLTLPIAIPSETLIVWTEPNGTDMALSFQEAEGCTVIW